MTLLRLVLGLVLGLLVSTLNGISGIAYTVGGEFEVSLQSALGAEEDARWQSREKDGVSSSSPRDAMATLSLLAESKFGGFGLFLQLFCWFQLLAGLILVFRSRAGKIALSFLILVAITGISVEFIAVGFSSNWGITNSLGAVVSTMLIPVAIIMYRNRDDPNQIEKAD